MAKSKHPYGLSLKLGDNVFKSSGETMIDALSALPKPGKILAKGVLTVRIGEESKDKLLMPLRVRRLFYPNIQRVIAKQLEVGL